MTKIIPSIETLTGGTADRFVVAAGAGVPVQLLTGAQAKTALGVTDGATGATGATGSTGATGATGAAGPNSVSGTTSTALSGILRGTGTVVDTVTVSTGLAFSAGSLSVSFGTTSTTVCVGNDSRLSDSRTPTAHAHPQSDITNLTTDLAAKQATLVSATNIKTINSTSLLGSGDIVVSASPAGSSGQVQFNNAGAFGGAAAIVYAGSGTHVVLTAESASVVPLCVRGAASQTASLVEAKNSSGTVVAKVDPSGRIYSGDAYFYSTGPYQWELRSTYGKDFSREGGSGLVAWAQLTAPALASNGSQNLCIDGSVITIGKYGMTGTTHSGTTIDAAIYAQKGGAYNSTVYSTSRKIYLVTFNGGNAVSGNSNGGDGGSVVAMIGAGGTGTGSGVSGAHGTFEVQTAAGTVLARIDQSQTAGDSRLLLWDVDSGSLKRVSIGAADSGGTGFKVLRVPN